MTTKPIHKAESHLLEELIEQTSEASTVINGQWFRARALNFNKSWALRIAGAWRVLTGQSIAVHFKENE